MLCQLNPSVVVTCSKTFDKRFQDSLNSIKNRGAEIVYLPTKDFAFDNGFHRLLPIAAEVH